MAEKKKQQDPYAQEEKAPKKSALPNFRAPPGGANSGGSKDKPAGDAGAKGGAGAGAGAKKPDADDALKLLNNGLDDLDNIMAKSKKGGGAKRAPKTHGEAAMPAVPMFKS